LTVLACHLRHPSRTAPRHVPFGVAVMRRVCADDEPLGDAIAAGAGRPGGFDRGRGRWRQVGPQKGWEDALNERKRAAGDAMPPWVVAAPLDGEATVAHIDPAAPSGRSVRVLAWSRSVAERPVVGSGARPTTDGRGA
jgi:hypothetical protein